MFSTMTPTLEQTTARRYYFGTIFQGIWTTGQYLFPFVLAKSLAAPDWLVTLSVMMETSGMVLGLYWGQIMATGGRRRALFWGGLLGRGVVVAALLVHSPGQFVAMLGVVYLFMSLVYPAQNSILQENIRPERRGEVFGRGALVQHLTAAVCSLIVGRLLETDPDSFRYIYPVLGILGFGYPLILSRLPRAPGPTAALEEGLPAPPVSRSMAAAIWRPFREAGDTFRRDRAYLWYQLNFTLYGVAFIMLVPVVPLYFNSELHLDYADIAQSRVLLGSLGIAILGPLAGRLMDRLHPTWLCAMSFGWVTLFPLAMTLGPNEWGLTPTQTAYTAFAIYSVGMAGVNITWNVGSIAFAPPGRGGHYQGIHVAMVGFRGIVAPLLGFLLLRFLGYREVFFMAAGLFMLAALSSVVLSLRMRRS